MDLERLGQLKSKAQTAEADFYAARNAWAEAALEYARESCPFKVGDDVTVRYWSTDPVMKVRILEIVAEKWGRDHARTIRYELIVAPLTKSGTVHAGRRQHRVADYNVVQEAR